MHRLFLAGVVIVTPKIQEIIAGSQPLLDPGLNLGLDQIIEEEASSDEKEEESEEDSYILFIHTSKHIF